MQITTLQNDFTSGEVDPKLRARSDLDQYRSALATAKNITVQPQGGAKRRPGSRYIASLPSDASQAVRMVAFEFSVSTSYMLVFTPGRMYVFKDGALVTNINGSGNDYLAVSDITSSIIPTMNWTQQYDTLIVVHEDLEPIKIFRGGNDSTWTASTLTLTNVPYYDYDHLDLYPKSTITPSETSGTITVTASAYTGDTGSLQAATTTTMTLKAAASAVDDIFVGLCIVMTSGAKSGQARKITDYVGATKVATVYPAWDTPPSAADNYKVVPYAAESVNQYINATPYGRARIVKYLTDTTVQAYVTVPFPSTDAITTGNHGAECFYEPVWSATRGWPRSVAFYQGRMYFGGSKGRPSTIWGSRVGQYFDFNAGESLADDSVEATADTGQLNAVNDIYPGRALQIFTTGGEFYAPQPGDDPITPQNFFLKLQTENGSRQGIRVINVEGGTIFVQRQGKALQEFIYADTQAAFTSARISLLSSHLLKSPSEMAVRAATSTDEGDRLIIVNGDDGTIACYTLLRSQKVIAASEWQTDGEYISIGVDVDDIYTVVKRTLPDTSVNYYVELFDEALFVDCAKDATVGSPTSGVSGLSFIEGKTVKVVRDGVVGPDKTVASGAITFDRDAEASYQVGLDYTITIKTLPAAPRLQQGSIRSMRKRVYDITADLFETQNLTIQGRNVAFRQFGENVLDSAVVDYTGIKKVECLLGYDREGAITITQNQPLKATILGIEYKLSVG